MTARRILRSAALPVVAVMVAVVVTASAGGHPHYRVRSGDTLSEIAARFHTSVAALVRLNDLPGNGNLIYAGSTLRLPGHHHHARQHAGHRHHAGHGHHGRDRARHHQAHRWVTVSYTVRPGDFLYGIAARYHDDPQRIARRNHLPSSLTVVIGQHLRLHVPHAARPHHHGFHGFWVPSRESVTRMIRAKSARWHIDTRFVLGISYEETGFNQRLISSVGAIGAMQVMPRTGEWVSAYVARRPLNLYRASDNVTAGVALLAVLLRETNGDMRLAAAGYYQGLASVRQRGMYDDTKRYVANVLALRNRF
jgi:LysM repeat protein